MQEITKKKKSKNLNFICSRRTNFEVTKAKNETKQCADEIEANYKRGFVIKWSNKKKSRNLIGVLQLSDSQLIVFRLLSISPPILTFTFFILLFCGTIFYCSSNYITAVIKLHIFPKESLTLCIVKVRVCGTRGRQPCT